MGGFHHTRLTRTPRPERERVAAWIRGPLYPLVRERLAGGALSSLLDLDVARRLLEEHKAGRRDWARPLWLLFVLASWADARRPAGIAT